MEDGHKQGQVSEKLYKIRHSLAHVMAQAVLQIRPKSKLAFGPPVDDGFYYDFDLDTPLTPEDLPEIEKRMREIIKQKQKFELCPRPAGDAVKFLHDLGEVYKEEYVQELVGSGEQEIGFYRNGPFEDMCRGPHVEHTGEIPADCFALDSIAGAYWRGDEKRPQLTRLYAFAFESKKELAEYQEKRRLAKERDHRKLGTELEIYTISDDVGPGLVMWLPNGTIILDALEDFAKETEFRGGYHRVSTPHITKEKLFYRSGHLPYYKDSMYPPMIKEGEEPYYLKPMNCPHHHMIYGVRPRSYRELPYRIAEYGDCYRFEDSGSLSGLLRVRKLSMNDAHIYTQPEKLRDEMKAVLDLHSFYYTKFRISDYWMRLSLHDANNKTKYIDDPQAWAFSEKVLQEVLEESGLRYETRQDEAAFYGPKVDFQIRNVIGREESASTGQLDFAGAPRFNLTYVGEDGKPHVPYIIHRAPLGTHERFIAFLIEHFGGAFPTWMSPLQVIIVPVGDKFYGYAEKLQQQLFGKLCRAEVDYSAESFNKKIRNAITRKTPNILIVGGKEEESESVTWRRYCVKEQRSLKFGEFLSILAKMIQARTMDNFADEPIPEA